MCGNNIGEVVQACLKLMTDIDEDEDWTTDDDPEVSSRGLLDYTTIFSPLSNSSFIQYCDSNIGLFSFASYKDIALPTIATAIVVAFIRS